MKKICQIRRCTSFTMECVMQNMLNGFCFKYEVCGNADPRSCDIVGLSTAPCQELVCFGDDGHELKIQTSGMSNLEIGLLSFGLLALIILLSYFWRPILNCLKLLWNIVADNDVDVEAGKKSQTRPDPNANDEDESSAPPSAPISTPPPHYDQIDKIDKALSV